MVLIISNFIFKFFIFISFIFKFKFLILKYLIFENKLIFLHKVSLDVQLGD